jgi:tetratricopeptide (TPR) repeat protein
VVYENYAQRLLSVYEESRDPLDFYNAEREFDKLVKSGTYTMNDLRSYGILYQYHMNFCKDTALRLFEKGLSMGEETDPETYHRIERQKILLHSQVGWIGKSIEEWMAKLAEHPQDYNCHLNLLASYCDANDNSKALEVFEQAEKKFKDRALLYVYGGDLYRSLGRYDEAFACWDKVLELDPEVCDARWSKGFCYEELGEYQKAYEEWTALIVWLEEKGYESEVEAPRRLAQKCKEKIEA